MTILDTTATLVTAGTAVAVTTETAGGLTLTGALDGAALGAGGFATGYACAEQFLSAKCGVDVASLGSGGVGVMGDLKALVLAEGYSSCHSLLSRRQSLG